MANIDVDGNKTPKALHAGVNSVIQRISLSASMADGDLLRVIKLPTGAIVDDVVFFAGADFVTTLGAIGIESDSNRFLVTASVSDAIRAIIGLGPANRISVSDGSAVRYEYLTIDFTVGLSAGVVDVGTVQCKYHLDD